MPYNLKKRLLNFASSSFILIFTYVFYANFGFYKRLFDKTFLIPYLKANVNFFAIFEIILIVYALSLFMIYMLEKKATASKSIYALRGIKKIILIKDFQKNGLAKQEKVALFATIVKVFFAPVMVFWLILSFSKMIEHGGIVYSEFLLAGQFLLSNMHFFWMLFYAILVVDLFFFSIGYLIELPVFKNKIISVEPTFLGWFVALICYPPFNPYLVNMIGWNSAYFPRFSNNYLTLIISMFILVLMAVYAWASVALGFKASNLTHRGIVAKGPYKFIRHPAYVCKNAAWWLGGLVFVVDAGKEGFFPVLFVLSSLAAWSAIYYLRALTEERHLISVNGEYRKYVKKVPYKFIPYVV